jgi:hypothetical protein
LPDEFTGGDAGDGFGGAADAGAGEEAVDEPLEVQDALPEEGEQAQAAFVQLVGVILGQPFGELVNAAEGRLEVMSHDVGEYRQFWFMAWRSSGALLKRAVRVRH